MWKFSTKCLKKYIFKIILQFRELMKQNILKIFLQFRSHKIKNIFSFANSEIRSFIRTKTISAE